MSRCFYVTNTEKKSEYDKFNKFWEEVLIPGTKQRIEDFCEQLNGKYVNNDFAEDIIEENLKSLTYTSLSSYDYDYEIGTLSAKGFYWCGATVEGVCICSKESLQKFLATHSKYILTDEYGTEVKDDVIKLWQKPIGLPMG